MKNKLTPLQLQVVGLLKSNYSFGPITAKNLVENNVLLFDKYETDLKAGKKVTPELLAKQLNEIFNKEDEDDDDGEEFDVGYEE